MVDDPTPMILVVDDSEDNRNLLTRMLQRGGYRTITAAGGLEAIEQVAKCGEQIDLILLDWMMPELSGVDVLRSVRDRYASDDMPVIMCTARDEGESVSAALADGANDYVAKPVNRDVLLARVASHLARKQSSIEQKCAKMQLEDTLAVRTSELAALVRGDAEPNAQRWSIEEFAETLSAITRAADRADLDRVRLLSQAALQSLQMEISGEGVDA